MSITYLTEYEVWLIHAVLIKWESEEIQLCNVNAFNEAPLSSAVVTCQQEYILIFYFQTHVLLSLV